MDDVFTRVKSIIERLRDVIKCKECSKLCKEDSAMFYHICDHFYCMDCISSDNSCPLCQNPLDKPIKVVSDKNMLALYQSLLNFELPSKDNVKKIYRNHKASKEILKSLENSRDISLEGGILDTPKLQRSNTTSNAESIDIGKSKVLEINSSEGEKKSSVEVGSSSNLGHDTPKKGKNFRTISNDEEKGIKIKIKNTTPLANEKSESIVRRNITKSANVTPVTPCQRTRKNLLGSSRGTASKQSVNKRNPKGETKLHLACKKSNLNEMAELIAAGANPNAQDNAGWTPLHDSVFSGNIEVIKFLLDNGAKVNTPGLENTTALHEAIAKGNVKVVKLLLEYGADVNAMNIFKETPMDLVTKYDLMELKEILLEATKNVNTHPESSCLEEEEQNFVLYNHNLSLEDEKLVYQFAEKYGATILPSITFKTSPTHIIVPSDKFDITWLIISSVLSGCHLVTSEWIKDCLKENYRKPVSNYEPPIESGHSKARINNIKQFPGLFSGCHFFLGGNFEVYTIKNITIRKDDLKILIEKNGGLILKRSPDPERLASEKIIPFHADCNSSLRDTSFFIIYQKEKWDPNPKYNMSHMKTLPVEWLIHSIFKFDLVDPKKDSSWCEFL